MVITNVTVVTLDEALGDLQRADILIEGGRIVAVGPDLGVVDAEVIEADGRIVIPGFINSHLHTSQHALRGVCADWTVKDHVRCWRVQLGPLYRPEDMLVGNYAGALYALNARSAPSCCTPMPATSTRWWSAGGTTLAPSAAWPAAPGAPAHPSRDRTEAAIASAPGRNASSSGGL